MRIVSWIGVIVGGILMVAGLVPVGYSFFVPLKTTIQWYGQVASLILGGGLTIFLSYYFRNTKISLPSVNTGKAVVPVGTDIKVNVENTKTVLPDKIILDAKRLADYECLNHLSERLAEAQDGEGVGLCRKLQDRLFELHHGKTPPTPLAVIKTVSAPTIN